MALVAAAILVPALASAQEEQSFFLDLDTGGHRAFVKDLAFSPDGEFLASASDDKTIRIWDWKSGVTIRTLRGQIGAGNDGKIFAIAISPDGGTIAAAGYFGPGLGDEPPYGDVRLFDFSTGKIKAVLKGPQYANYDLAFSPDGKFLATGGQDGLVYVWRRDAVTETGWVEHTQFDADTYRISQIGFGAGGDRLIATTADNGIRLWDMASQSELELPEDTELLRDSNVVSLAISMDGAHFAVGTSAGLVQIRQTTDGALVSEMPAQDFFVSSLTFARADTHLVVSCGYNCGEQNRSLVWKVDASEPPVEYRGHDGIVTASAATPDGLIVATAGGTRHSIHLWDPVTGKSTQVLEGRGRPINAVGADPKTLEIAWGNEDPCPQLNSCPNALGLLSLRLGLPSTERYFEKPELLVSGSEKYSRAVISADEWSLQASSGGANDLDNAVLEILKGGTVLHRIENDATNGYLHSAFTLIDGGTGLITGGNDGTLIQYDSATGKFVGEFLGGHTGEIHAMGHLRRPDYC